MNVTFGKWRTGLIQFVSTALSDFREQVSEQIAQFAVDCHPWHGSVILAFLTTPEVEESPFLSGADEMAAWKYYDFASVRSSTNSEIGQWMQDTYNQYAEKSIAADLFFEACAGVIASKLIQENLLKYNLGKGFKCTVSHPDTGKEYYPQGQCLITEQGA